jgi:DNA-binding NtrC family response regulator/glyoxylase-like metal-dependent hydrolase (beta-lactamase superfamily II)
VGIQLEPTGGVEVWGIRTRAPIMVRVLESLRRFATLDAPVLIQGETGTGKGLVAHALHMMSDRKDRPFVTIDCTVLPDTLAESELFGHERGAFTGADRSYAGRIEAAAGGTLFLDEINSLSLDIQGKLLRFLEEGKLQRLGQQRYTAVDVRIIAASNVPLGESLSAGRVRLDFFHRLNVLALNLPPLRQRVHDIPLLVHQFLERDSLVRRCGVTRVADDVIHQLCAMPWPGNVRELHNLLRRSIALSADDGILRCLDVLADVAPSITMPTQSPAGRPEATFRVWMRQREHEYLERLSDGRQSIAQQAETSGLPERTLYRKLRSFGLRPGHGPAPSPEPAERRAVRRSPVVVIAPNPSITTGPGTNQYLLGEREMTLLDVAELTDDNARRLDEALRLRHAGVAGLVLTHVHLDHSGGAAALRKQHQAPIAVHATHRHFLLDGKPLAPERLLADDDEIAYEGGSLRVLHAPGHEGGHCCYYDPARRWLYSGDLVSSVGPVVVAPPEGDMGAYLASLRRILALKIDLILPGHGPPIDEPLAAIEREIHDVLAREQRIIAILADPPRPMLEIVEDLYSNLNPLALAYAALTVRAHVGKLVDEGVVVETSADVFRLVG